MSKKIEDIDNVSVDSREIVAALTKAGVIVPAGCQKITISARAGEIITINFECWMPKRVLEFIKCGAEAVLTQQQIPQALTPTNPPASGEQTRSA